MSDLLENLKTEFQEPEYRYGYAESFLNTKLATQIKTLREQRDYTQEEVAALMGIKQPGYRRFEDVNHAVWKTDSLWSIARAYGVRLDINFKPFGSLLEEKKHFNKENLRVPAFEDDPAFKEPAIKEPEPEAAFATAEPGLPLTDLGGFGLSSGPGDEDFMTALARIMAPYLSKGTSGLVPGPQETRPPEEPAGGLPIGEDKGIYLVVDNSVEQGGTAPSPPRQGYIDTAIPA